MVGRDNAAEAGKQALAALRRSTAERLVNALDDHDPRLLAALSEIGVLRRAWVEDPDSGPMSEPPAQVVHRVLERAVERKPSVIASLGLSVVQTLDALGHVAATEDTVSETLVVGFTDLEAFTRFTARHGDGAASALLDRHHRAMGRVIRSRGGRVVKRLGDGSLVTFPEAAAAVLAGLELVEMQPGGCASGSACTGARSSPPTGTSSATSSTSRPA